MISRTKEGIEMRYLIAIQICLSLITGNLSAQRTSSRIPPQDTIRNQRVTQTPAKPVETLPIVVARFYTMKKLVTNENFRLMGFESMEEVSSAKLDPPIKDFMVQLDRLKRYVPGTNPDLLLTETGQQIFPVSAGEHVRSSMTLKRSLFFWKALSYGSPNFIKRLTEIIALSSVSTEINRSAYFVVRIPALHVDFAGYHKNQVLFLVPLSNDRNNRYTALTSYPAERIFTILLPDALACDNLPR